MTKIDNVVNLLAKEELTSKEIAEKLDDITPDIVYVYLNKLLNSGIIERTTDKKPYKYKKSLTPIELLKFYNNFFEKNIDYILKNSDMNKFIEKNEKIFDKIEEVIING